MPIPKGVEIALETDDALDRPDNQLTLRRYLKLVDANPLVAYYPHAKQVPFHRFIRKIRVFLGGNRSGKSVAGILDDLIQAVDQDVLPPHLAKFKIWQPPFRCRIVVPDFGRPFGAVLETIRQWVPPSQLSGGSWETAYRDKDHVLNFANGSFFEFMTCEQDISKFGGTSRERIHYDEEPKGAKGEEIREENAQRLIETRGDEIFTFSPVHGLGWTYDQLWELKGSEVEPEVWVNDAMVIVRADQDDNPHLDARGREEAEAKTRLGMRDARKSGKFVHAAGLVYESFGEAHVCPTPAPEFVQSLTQYDGIDPGIVTTAVLFSGIDTDGILWIYDELFLSDKWAVPQYAAEKLRKKRADWGLPLHPRLTLIDPAGASRNVQTGERTDRAYRRAGVKVFPARNDVEAGIFEVLRRLEHTDGEGNPQPLIRIAENCERLRWEIGRYRKEQREDGGFAVVKKDDHGCDVMRYLCLQHPLPEFPNKGKRHTQQVWVPGTAPAFVHQPRPSSGPLGIFS